jgi:anti-sigma regulatory factor (Ser/Thr protein kinase)/CheY-like chemotaxis protein
MRRTRPIIDMPERYLTDGFGAPDRSPDAAARPRVVVIRPAASLVQTLASVLDLGGCELEACRGNVEALRSLRARAADVVITDVSTTIEEDIALAKELMSVRPSVRVIVLAASAAHEDLVDAIRAHVFACFSPPIDYREVAAMTSSALLADRWNDGIQVVSGLDRWLTLRVSCGLLTADRLVRFMTELQASAGHADRDRLIAAFRELLLNAMEHGAGFDPDKVIEVTAARTARAIVYHFRDPGDGFNRADLRHATSSPRADDVQATVQARAEKGLRAGGFGMLIARQVADELVYNERGNEVLLIKYLD